MAHFHFTLILMPALLASPQSRVINISSDAEGLTFSGGINFDTLKGPKNAGSIKWPAFIGKVLLYGQVSHHAISFLEAMQLILIIW